MSRPPLDALLDPERLAALQEADLLDRPPAPSLDRYTRIASLALGVPVSLVSLVDDHRQFFSSQVGLPEPWQETRETPLSHSFCKHVVADRAPLIVEDAREHPTVRDNPAIRDLSVIAYAGIPIETHDEQVVGSFCAIDSQPRVWTERELTILRDLAAAVSEEVDLRRRLARIERSERSLTVLNERMMIEQAALLERTTNAIHDLRNPLAVTLMGVQHLSQHAGLQGFAELTRLTAMIQRNIDHASSLMASMTSGVAQSEHLVPLEVGKFVQQVCSDTSIRTSQVSVTVEVRASAVTLIAPTQFRRSVENLLSNAQRFATQIVARVDVQDGEILVSVEDNGPGLPTEGDYQRVWQGRQRFHEAEGKSGTGRGLAIVREVIEQAGGHVQARRSALGGACFILSLPVYQ